jgi:hypothetical protein
MMHDLTPKSVAGDSFAPHKDSMITAINDLVLQALHRAPQWVRQDLLTSDPVVRARAEETLAAMISSALAAAQDGEADNPSGDQA